MLATQIPEGHITHTCISHQQYCVPKVEATLWEYDSCPGGQSLWWETPSMPASQLCKTLFPGKSPNHSVHTYWWPNQPCCVFCIPLWLAAAGCSTKSWSQSRSINGMPSYWCSTNGHLWCQPLVSAFGFLILYICVFAEIHALRGRVNQGSWQEYKEKMYSALPLLFS